MDRRLLDGRLRRRTPSGPMSTALRIAVALATLAGCAGCGLKDPYNRSEPKPVTRKAQTTSGRPARESTVPAQVEPPRTTRAGSAPQTLSEFAQAYGNIAPHSTRRRRRILESLATKQLAREIARETHGSPTDVPRGGSLSSEIVNLDVAPSQGRHREAVVALQQRLAFADGRTEQPITNLFVAALVLTPAGWRVASFTPQQ